jgi:hypothetical protein
VQVGVDDGVVDGSAGLGKIGAIATPPDFLEVPIHGGNKTRILPQLGS